MFVCPASAVGCPKKVSTGACCAGLQGSPRLMSSSVSSSAPEATQSSAAPSDSTYVLDAMIGSEGLDKALQAEGHPKSRSFSFWSWLMGRQQS